MWVWLSIALVGVILFALSVIGIVAARPWRVSGFALAVVSLMIGASYLSVSMAFLSWLVLMVIVIAALPWASWLLGQDQQQAKTNKLQAV